MSKLTSEKQPKKLMNGLFGSFRKNKSKVKINLDVESQQDNNGTMSFDVVVKVINGNHCCQLKINFVFLSRI